MKAGTLAAIVLAAGIGSAAAQTAVTVKNDSKLRGALKELGGKSVTLHLDGGTTISGKLKLVGDNVVQLSEVTGKDFYDAVIDVDAIQAFEYRAR